MPASSKMKTSISNCKRHDNWPMRLVECTEAHIESFPDWGVSDCLMMAADAMFAVTGTDPLSKFRGKYTTEQGAAKLMLKNGCENVEDVFEKYLGMEPMGRFSFRRGDVGTIEISGGIAAGYFTEQGFAVKQESGLRFFDVTEVRSVFKVGI